MVTPLSSISIFSPVDFSVFKYSILYCKYYIQAVNNLLDSYRHLKSSPTHAVNHVSLIGCVLFLSTEQKRLTSVMNVRYKRKNNVSNQIKFLTKPYQSCQKLEQL